jgi:hypothetical protein
MPSVLFQRQLLLRHKAGSTVLQTAFKFYNARIALSVPGYATQSLRVDSNLYPTNVLTPTGENCVRYITGIYADDGSTEYAK